MILGNTLVFYQNPLLYHVNQLVTLRALSDKKRERVPEEHWGLGCTWRAQMKLGTSAFSVPVSGSKRAGLWLLKGPSNKNLKSEEHRLWS